MTRYATPRRQPAKSIRNEVMRGSYSCPELGQTCSRPLHMRFALFVPAILCVSVAAAHATKPAPAGTSITAAQGQLQGQLQAQRQGQRQRQQATGGAATITGLTGIQGGAWGGAGGSVGNVLAGGVDLAGARIGSDVTMERSAPPLYGATPTQPTQPCARPGFTIGGSSRDGSGLLSIPTGTDVTCRVDNALTIMARNPKLFSDDDRLTVSCKQEDIAETQACKDLAKRKAEAARAQAALEGRPAPVAQQPMPWQAGG